MLADVAVSSTPACARIGVLGRRGFASESAVASCSEAGGRVRTPLDLEHWNTLFRNCN